MDNSSDKVILSWKRQILAPISGTPNNPRASVLRL